MHMNLILNFAIIFVLFSVTQCSSFDIIEDYNAKRLEVFNTKPYSRNKVFDEYGELKDKNEIIRDYTTMIDDAFMDDAECIAKDAQGSKTEIFLKIIMGSAIMDKPDMYNKGKIPENTYDPYFTIISEARNLFRDLVNNIRCNGFGPVNTSDLDQYKHRYNNLFSFSRVKKEDFALWFNEVFTEHEPGFRLENPDLGIRSYHPLEPVVTKGILKPDAIFPRITSDQKLWRTPVSFDFKCDYPHLCDHSDHLKFFRWKRLSLLLT